MTFSMTDAGSRLQVRQYCCCQLACNGLVGGDGQYGRGQLVLSPQLVHFKRCLAADNLGYPGGTISSLLVGPEVRPAL